MKTVKLNLHKLDLLTKFPLLIFLSFTLGLNCLILKSLSIFFSPVNICIIQNSTVFSFNSQSFIIFLFAFNLNLNKLFLSSQIYIFLSFDFLCKLIVFQSQQMNLFFHIFNLVSHVLILVLSCSDLASYLFFAFVFIRH